MRRKLFWRIAARLPQTMEISGRTASSPTTAGGSGASPTMRSTASRMAALTTVAM